MKSKLYSIIVTKGFQLIWPFSISCSWSEAWPFPASRASIFPGLWLVESDHVTWMLASDWSRASISPGREAPTGPIGFWLWWPFYLGISCQLPYPSAWHHGSIFFHLQQSELVVEIRRKKKKYGFFSNPKKKNIEFSKFNTFCQIKKKFLLKNWYV